MPLWHSRCHAGLQARRLRVSRPPRMSSLFEQGEWWSAASDNWPPQSSDLNPIEMVGDELDRRLKEKQPTSAQHMWELLQDCVFLMKQSSWQRVATLENVKYTLICLILFWLRHDSPCFFIILRSSLLFDLKSKMLEYWSQIKTSYGIGGSIFTFG